MKRIHLLTLGCISLFGLIFLGCNNKSAPSAPMTITPVASTVTPAIPTRTIQPTLALTTPPPFPTSTSIPTVTLSAEEKKQRILHLLSTDVGCTLPCFWGITPGTTKLREAESILLEIGATLGSKSDPQEETRMFGTGGLDFEADKIYNDIFFVERSGIVERLHVAVRGASNPAFFQEAWRLYSPENILSANGVPNRVWIGSSSINLGDRGRNGYILWIFYDELGFMIRYEGSVKHEPIYHFCPSLKDEEDISSLRIDILAPTITEPLEAYDGVLSGGKWGVRTLKEVTGMSVEEFHALFAQEGGSGCFDTPREVWP